MVAWDSLHYLTIAVHGYPANINEAPENICFFPMLPLLSRALIPLLGAEGAADNFNPPFCSGPATVATPSHLSEPSGQ